jgi:hypothetical protein
MILPSLLAEKLFMLLENFNVSWNSAEYLDACMASNFLISSDVS